MVSLQPSPGLCVATVTHSLDTAVSNSEKKVPPCMLKNYERACQELRTKGDVIIQGFTQGVGPWNPPPAPNFYSLILMHDAVAMPHKLLPPPPSTPKNRV